jgi:hypothetical protein
MDAMTTADTTPARDEKPTAAMGKFYSGRTIA